VTEAVKNFLARPAHEKAVFHMQTAPEVASATTSGHPIAAYAAARGRTTTNNFNRHSSAACTANHALNSMPEYSKHCLLLLPDSCAADSAML
jgi:hypothetical protein